MGLKEDKIKAVQWSKLTADQGDASTQCYLGYCYQKGKSVKEGKVKAAK